MKGILVYADGRIDPVDPSGNVITKPCGCCGGDLVFVVSEFVAEDRNTLDLAKPIDRKLLALSQGRSPSPNEGCVVYIQQKNDPRKATKKP